MVQGYGKAVGPEGVVLPYLGKRFGMLLVMPAGGVDKVSWDGTNLATWLGAAKEHNEMQVNLPKWESNLAADLTGPLQQLGLVTPFVAGTSDLAGIGTVDGASPCVSGVQHKAVVKVDETGTEAAAVTSVGIVAMAAVHFTEVSFNRPFVFALVDLWTGVPLFLGQVNNPLL